jgi:hypothetical protein
LMAAANVASELHPAKEDNSCLQGVLK